MIVHASVSRARTGFVLGALAAAACLAAGPQSDSRNSFDSFLVVGPVADGGRSAIRRDAIEELVVRGTFSPPHEGEVVHGPDGRDHAWTAVAADAERLQHPALRSGYAFASVELDAPRTMILEASGHTMVYVNGVPRVGDPYGYGFVRIPVELDAGPNSFLFACGRGSVAARLLPCPSEAPYFLEGDDTVPELVTGAPKEWLIGVPIANPTGSAATGLVIEATAADGTRTRTDVPTIPPLGIHKASVRVRTGAPAAGPSSVSLALLDGERSLANRTLELRAVEPSSKRRITFRSAIDGSAQYYSVVPPSTPATQPGLLLSLHGASVQATNQAACFAPKADVVVVCPTNRRPYGFDWEEWGRLDALEVLADAAERFDTNPQRQWLTGHSMGGHGTWQLGAHFPGRFAAIAPSAGWISFQSYGGAPRFADAGVEGIFRRAASPSDTLALKENFTTEGVYILHGDADETVPVREARAMRALLAGGDGAFHSDFAYYERPGAGHWWGDQCMDWPPLIEFLLSHELPQEGSRRQLAFVTSHPGVSDRFDWVRVDQALSPMAPSRVEVDLDLDARRVRASTTNVARLGLQPPLSGGPTSVVLDGTTLDVAWTGSGTLWFERTAEGWRLIDGRDPNSKRAERCGPFKDAIRNEVVFVYGTMGSPDENARLLQKARYDADQFWYRGNGTPPVLADKAFDPAKRVGADIVLYGNADTNSVWPAVLANSPLLVRSGSVKLGDEEITGDDLACLAVRPRSDDPDGSVAIVAGTGAVGTKLTFRLPYMTAGVAFPDCVVLGSDYLTAGFGGVRVAGFFGNDWSVERGVWSGTAEPTESAE